MPPAPKLEYVASQPLTCYRWPFDVPTKLRLGISVGPAPALPNKDDEFWRWALSGREIESLRTYTTWIRLAFLDSEVSGTVRQMRAAEIVRLTRIAVQIVRPVGCPDSTILISREKAASAFPMAPLTSTPWGRIVGFNNCSLVEIQKVVRGVHQAFRAKITRLINPINLLQLALESSNQYLRPFLFVCVLDSLLMAGDSNPFKRRLSNFLGEGSFALPASDFLGQPKYSIGEIAEDLYALRSVVAHGQVIPPKFLAATNLFNIHGAAIAAYPPNPRYIQVLQECALFTLTSVLRRIFLENRIQQVNDTAGWRARLDHPF